MKRPSIGRASAGSRHVHALRTTVAALAGAGLLDQAYNDCHSVPQLPRDIRRHDRVVGLALRWRNQGVTKA